MKRISVILVLILPVLLSSCLKEDELKDPFVSYVPSQLEDGWQISTPEYEKINPAALTEIFREFHSDNDLWQVRSLLVFRNGKLVAESYLKDQNDIITPRAVWSNTKQVLGLLTGIALEKQLIKSVNDPVSDYLSEATMRTDKMNIRISHLLSMKSGISYSNDGLKGQTADILRKLPEKITSYILNLPMEANPGIIFRYKDGDPQLLSAIIQARCGKTTSQWAKEVLFDRLEIKNLMWNNYRDGTTLGGFGILTTPRELAKFGQLVLDSGQWKGSQIVKKEWIREITTIREKEVYGFQFGYLWWIDNSRGMIFMWGHGGQYVFIIPSKKLVIVITSEVNTQDDFQLGNKAFAWVDRISAISE
jgi:CubicO group peptidase (beta-lactamase class C family)